MGCEAQVDGIGGFIQHRLQHPETVEAWICLDGGRWALLRHGPFSDWLELQDPF